MKNRNEIKITSMKTNVARYFLLISSIMVLCSLGEKGHQKINGSSAQFFPARLNIYKGWSDKPTEYGSDADNRKRTDHTKGIKHYIDIEAYTYFVQTKDC